tara:strand:- start:121 stop:429 length:309 start_codon:yes stop_codon:yes gene_type:complete
MDNQPTNNGEPPKLPFGGIIEDQHYNTDIYRSTKPHMAVVTLKIDIRAMNSDESLDPRVMGNRALQKYGIAQKGQFVVRGTSEADCIKKLKTILENINNGQG